MIGVPCVGKTTYIKETFKNKKIISSDDIRLEIFGNLKAGNTSNGNQKTWRLINKRLKKAFESKEVNDIVLDATNLSRKRRIPYYNQAHKYGYKVESIWLEKPYDIIVKRNKARKGSDKYIPSNILKDMFVRLEPPILNLDCDCYYFNQPKHNVFHGYELRSFQSFVLYFLGRDPFEYQFKENGKWHQESIESHLRLTSAIGAMTKYPDKLRIVGLWHDIGKDFVRNWVDKDKTWAYYNHDVLSARLFYLYHELLYEYQIPDSITEYKIIRWHMMALKGPISPKVIKREDLSSAELDMLRIFAKIDSFSRIGRKGYETDLSKLIK